MKTYDKGELAKKILLAAVGTAAIATVLVLPGMGILLKMFNADDSKEQWRLRRALKRLEERRFIARKVVRGKEVFVVTKYGKDRIDKYFMADLEIRPKKWDGRWRVLMFDIPERQGGGRIRRDVSRQLREMGMKAVQNSVFITPFPCKEQLDIVAAFFKIKKHFLYLEADTYEGVDDLLKFFDLSKRH